MRRMQPQRPIHQASRTFVRAQRSIGRLYGLMHFI